MPATDPWIHWIAELQSSGQSPPTFSSLPHAAERFVGIVVVSLSPISHITVATCDIPDTSIHFRLKQWLDFTVVIRLGPPFHPYSLQSRDVSTLWWLVYLQCLIYWCDIWYAVTNTSNRVRALQWKKKNHNLQWRRPHFVHISSHDFENLFTNARTCFFFKIYTQIEATFTFSKKCHGCQKTW